MLVLYINSFEITTMTEEKLSRVSPAVLPHTSKKGKLSDMSLIL